MAEFMGIHAKAPDHLSWAVEVAYYTVARPGPVELFSLQWRDVDWKKKRIRIRSAKTGGWRWQYPDKKFMARLREKYAGDRKNYPECPWIIHFNGSAVKSIKKAWIQAKEDAGITRKIRFYDIRHYYITYALAGGADIMELAERVGHTTPEMIIKVYAHLAKDLRRNKAHKLPFLYSKKSATVDKSSRQMKKAAQGKAAK
jgi:integrase